MVELNCRCPRSALFWRGVNTVLTATLVGMLVHVAKEVRGGGGIGGIGGIDVVSDSQTSPLGHTIGITSVRQRIEARELVGDDHDTRDTEGHTSRTSASLVAHSVPQSPVGTAHAAHAVLEGAVACVPSEPPSESSNDEILLREQWDAYVRKRASAPPAAYCMWQCGENQCCQGGERNIKHFPVVSNTLVPLNRQEGLRGEGSAAVTLATQGTVDRIDIFEEQVRRWPGPKVVVFAVFNHTADAAASAAADIARLRAAAKGWRNTLVRLAVLEHYPGVDTYSRNIEDPTLTLYPVNTLRNVAVDEAPTNWVFPLDIDFVPSETLCVGDGMPAPSVTFSLGPLQSLFRARGWRRHM
jgi:hypothetical protein